MIRIFTYYRRGGHTVLEVTIALAILLIVGMIVAQSIVWSLRERQRLAAHHAALEIAANVLEEAQALPFEQLDQAWAEAQTLPSEVAGMLPEGKLLVTIATMKDAAQAKRVTVEVRWQQIADMPPRSVTLATVLSGRSAIKKGNEP